MKLAPALAETWHISNVYELGWSDYGQDNRDEYESIGETKDDDSEPEAEEHQEDVSLWRRKDYDRNEGRKAAVKDAWSHLPESHLCFVGSDLLRRVEVTIIGKRSNEVRVGNVRRVVNRCPNRKNDIEYSHLV